MQQGWIKLQRKILDHWIYNEKRKFSKFEAWIDLLLMVNHEDKKVAFGNEIINVKRGQRVTSIRQLCERWGWSNTKVTQFLKLLQIEGMTTVTSDNKKTLITITNYDFYQSRDDEKTTQNSRKNDMEQIQKHTNKNDKNDKNDKNNNIRHKFEICDMKLAELLYERILQNNPSHKKPNLEKWANDIRLMRERDGRTVEQIEYLINWTQNHSFWHTNILSPAKLRKQFDKLVLQVKQEHNSNVTPITNAKNSKYKYNLGF